MKSIALLSIFLCFFAQLKAQASVYDCGTYPSITQTQIENAGPEFSRPCVELNGNYNFQGSSKKKIISATSIHAMPGFSAGPYNADGGMNLDIKPKSEFDVAVMNYTELNNILKYEKLELGVGLPADILLKVNNYVNGVVTPDTINPYLEWELRIVAEFTKGGNTPITVDGFYSRDFTSQMVDPLPLPANSGTVLHPNYTDEEYRDLGSWTETPTAYPFRVRFAPPALGNWQCVVKIYAGAAIYESAQFDFKVIESGNPGYMEVSSGKRYLSYNNQTFYPIGCNSQWPETAEAFDPELDQYMVAEYGGNWGPRPEGYRNYYVLPRVYDKYKGTLSNLIDNGANYFRTIMYPTGTEIEWEKLGDYTGRLHMAQELDEILELAENRDVFLHWDLQTHYTFQYSHPAYDRLWTWEYTTLDGKPFCYKSLTGSTNPVTFLTHEESKKYYKQRLRYIMARYGYSTSISAFELMCEISNIGTQQSDKNDFYLADTNWKMYRDWQVEMAEYIKSQYNGKVHLVTANFVGLKQDDDNTFNYEAFDIMTTNIYDFNEPSYSKFWSSTVSKTMLNDLNFSSYTDQILPSTSRNFKPLLFSETDHPPTESDCPDCHIERNRMMWESMFSGLGGALSWNAWYKTNNYAIFGQMKNFISQFDLDGERWHPGASEQFSSDAWFYKPNYFEDMYAPEKKADIAYLRSGDGNYAIGVITNKTYNVYTAGNCPAFNDKWDANSSPQVEAQYRWEEPDQTAESVNTGDEGLKLRGMHSNKYYVNYFYPTDLSTPFHSSDNVGPKVKLEVEVPASSENYIVLFMARRKNHDWMAPLPEDTLTFEEILNDPDIWQDATFETESLEDSGEEIDIEVFPVPSSDRVFIEAEQHQGQVEVIVESMEGRLIRQFLMQGDREELDLTDFERGTYYLKFLVKGKIIDNRKIIKL